MTNQNPEQIARDEIDRKLKASGWVVQAMAEYNPSAAIGIAVKEYQTDVGPADYVLFVNGTACGVIEAKPATFGHKLNTVELQSQGYANANLKWVGNKQPLPFVYESTGTVTRFSNGHDPKPRARELFSFHRPETLAEWLQQGDSLRSRLQTLPTLPETKLRACQINAVGNLETSFKANRPRALIQMATGAGKTYTAVTLIYRLLKHANAKRVLFLVDTKNLGEQAEQEFMTYVPQDDNRKFTELYNVSRLRSSYVPDSSQVVISTIQRMYAILKGTELSEDAELENPAEHRTLRREPLPVVYNHKLPPEFFDFVVIDECHRSIYNTWMQVLDYFDAFQVGLTATPDNRSYGYFEKNVVSEYTHEQAVIDGVNVQGDTFRIRTEVSEQGGTIKAERQVQRRHKLTRAKRWEQSDEEESYSAKELDRSVVNPDQIRTVIRAFRDSLPTMFPGRKEVPKTLIFAKTDSHADDIIRTVRKEFDAGNEFCKKVTYQIKEDPKSVLAAFRNDFHPRIAVTVDMIATGTDVKALECLLFMRDVKSRNYFEQMKGRGTRVFGGDELKKRSPTANGDKTHYVLVDAVGVTESIKTDSPPLESKPTVSTKNLLTGLLMGGGRDDESVTSTAGRLARIDRRLSDTQREQIKQATDGLTVKDLARDLLDAINPDAVQQQARLQFKLNDTETITSQQQEQIRSQRVALAVKPLNMPLINLMEGIQREQEQSIDHDTLDSVIDAGWTESLAENNQKLISEFSDWLNQNRDDITALQLFYGQPYQRRDITEAMVKELLTTLKLDRPTLAPSRVWQAYAQLDELSDKAAPAKELTALVALVRRASGIDEKLAPFDKTVRRNFKRWIMQRNQSSTEKLNDTQMQWLRMMRDHIAQTFHLHRDDLEYTPFDRHGGIGGMHQQFGEQMDAVIDELNEVLAA